MAALNLDLAQHDYVFISFLSILAAPYGDNVLWRPEDNLGIYEGGMIFFSRKLQTNYSHHI